MEVTRVGVRTRARAKTTKVVNEEIADNLGSSVKRRRLSDEKKRSHSSSFVQTQSINHEIYVNLTSDSSNIAASLRSRSAPGSCCSSTGSVEKLKVSDLEENISAENETVVRHNLDGSESTPTMEFKTEPVELDSCTPKQSLVMAHDSRTKMPPEAELEEFFTAANKDLKKRFTDKYNYDIVNDIPLKGRFEWIQLKPAT